MSTQTTFNTPDHINVELYIAQANQLRSEYIARSVKSGFLRLRNLLSFKSGLKTARA